MEEQLSDDLYQLQQNSKAWQKTKSSRTQILFLLAFIILAIFIVSLLFFVVYFAAKKKKGYSF